MLIITLLLAGPFWQPARVNATPAATFGNTSIGNLVNSFSTNKDASRFQLSQSGTIMSIVVYFATSQFDAKAAIYTDSNGVPDQLISQSPSALIVSKGWHQFAVPPESLSTGYYWLSVVCDQSNAQGAMSLATTGNLHATIAGCYPTEFTSSFGSQPTFDSYSTSIYAILIPTTTSSLPPPPSMPSPPTSTSPPSKSSPVLPPFMPTSPKSPPSMPFPSSPKSPPSMPSPAPPNSGQSPSQTIAFGLYWDQACTSAVSAISWGSLSAGSTQSLTIYVRNEGNVQITLYKSFSNWNPANAADYITIGWDYSNQLLSPGSTLKVTLTAAVSSGASALNGFSYNFVITAEDTV